MFGEESRILVKLLELGKADITTLVRELGFSRQAITNNVELLIRHGLAYDEYERYPPNRRFIYLTEKGKKVAGRMKEILKIIED